MWVLCLVVSRFAKPKQNPRQTAMVYSVRASAGEIVLVLFWLGVVGFLLLLAYGVVIIVFKMAFGVQLWNPFG